MFSYYGSKSKIIDKYPAPVFDHIIEPFAGSARYALKYWDRQVTLVDKYRVICDVWNYLIQASPKDIEALPAMKQGDKVPEYLSQPEQYLMGFIANSGSQMPKKSFTKWAIEKDELNRHKKRILAHLDKIRHWKVIHGSYEILERERDQLTT